MSKANTNYVVTFTEPGSTELSLCGGKGSNLGVLTNAGFPVPPGFTITTDAVSEFLAATKIGDEIQAKVKGLKYDDADSLERVTTEIKQLIVGAPMPEAVAAKIKTAYQTLGKEPHVAVRSSGTAEDLAGTSFAGLHDTYLDIKGNGALLDAVKRCWASMWNARAAAYRQNNQFDQSKVQMAVVVQIMVESEVSGVMFTANPLTTATDEIVINASWGLGEAVVSGIVTPDEYAVSSTTLKPLEKTLGTKALQIVRDPETGRGTVEQHVSETKRAQYCMTDAQLTELAKIGLRIQAHYEGFPQDIEWGMANNTMYMLQSRPVTGVEFSWDADIDEAAYTEIADDPDTVWTRAYAQTFNPGASTPLTYSSRYLQIATVGGWPTTAAIVGLPELSKIRLYKYWKGFFYYNTYWERKFVEHSTIPLLRPFVLDWTNPAEAEEIIKAPFSYEKYLQFLIKVLILEPEKGPIGNLKRVQYWGENATKVGGLTKEELSGLPDAELKQYVRRYLEYEIQYLIDCSIGFQIWFRDLNLLLAWIIDNWYDGGNPSALGQLLSSSSAKTNTQIENDDLWRFSEKIRHSKTLLGIFKASNGEAAKFFKGLEDCDEGRAWLAEYRPWAVEYQHRGESDRDMIYPRRGDDPFVDYKIFQAFLGMEHPVAPEVTERQSEERQQAAFEDVLANLRAKPFGDMKAMVFKTILELVRQWMVARDNERERPTDKIMYEFMKGFAEMGRRLHERGLLDKGDDHLYLGEKELYDLFEGRTTKLKLTKAKIAARRRDCERMNQGANPLPKFLQRNRAVDLSPDAGHLGPGHFRARTMNNGIVTGTARVVPTLAGIARVKKGEILVTNATDPGWTPVFMMLSGIVTETGGLMSHASCLAREYGFPAVTLENAMQLIPDGATITIDGDTGAVILVDSNGTDGLQDSATTGAAESALMN